LLEVSAQREALRLLQQRVAMARPPLVLSDAPNIVAPAQIGFQDTDGTFSGQRAEEINFKIDRLRTSTLEPVVGSPVVCGLASRDTNLQLQQATACSAAPRGCTAIEYRGSPVFFGRGHWRAN